MASDKEVTIIVEGTPHQVPMGKITYVQVVTLFDPTYPQHPERTYLVKYRKGSPHQPEGVLPVGGEVEVKNGMIFNVTPTGQS